MVSTDVNRQKKIAALSHNFGFDFLLLASVLEAKKAMDNRGNGCNRMG